ncbi:MAG: iron-containing alcohol dehydrogenase [Bacteroidetes bacterium]|nr:iron-containing alcohol dehydrogenase [Bacteroidota bacterium]
MENFILYNPTKLYFGRDVVAGLGKTVESLGKTALLVYGGGSIKRNGIYDQIMAQLEGRGIRVIEYSGIKPNPLVDDVDKASELARKEKVDFIVAVGGGSVIDSAKVMSVAV